MKVAILLCLILIQPWITYSNFDDWMIFLKQILVYRKAHFVYSFTCFNHKESTILFQTMNNLNISMSFLNFKLNFDVVSSNKLNFIIDLSCANSLNVLNEVTIRAGKLNLYQSHHKWLFVDLKSRLFTNNSVVPNEIANISIRMDSDILIARPIYGNGTHCIVLTDMYKMHYKYSNSVRLNDVLIWKSNNFTANIISKYNQRKNMNGTMLKAAIVCLFFDILNSTSVDFYYRHLSLRNFDTINKVNYNLFLHIQEMYNFTLQQLLITDKWYGNKGGMEGGLAKLLYNDIVDVSATSSTFNPERVKCLDYISPTYPFRSSFIFINSGTPQKLGNSFSKPFSLTVWCYIVGYVFLFWIILKYVLIKESSILAAYPDNDNSWFSTYLLIWAVFCQQGATFIPKHISGQFTLLSLLLMSFILYNYYTSSIVSSLLLGLSDPISTLEELTTSNLDIGLEDTPYIRTFLKVSNESNIKNFYSSKILKKPEQALFLSVEDGISQVQRGGFAYHTETVRGYSVIEAKFEPYQICNLAEIDLYNPADLWVVAQKRSQYKKLFAIGYLKMLQSGITKRQQYIFMTKKPACLSNAEVVTVGMSYLLPAFLVLILGVFGSAFILIIELLVAKSIIQKLLSKIKIWK